MTIFEYIMYVIGMSAFIASIRLWFLIDELSDKVDDLDFELRCLRKDVRICNLKQSRNMSKESSDADSD